MSDPEPQSAAPPPERPWFQFSLRTLLLLFVVLGSSLAVFGAWGIVVFALVLGLATYLRRMKSFVSLAYLALAVLCLACLIGLLALPILNSADEAGYRPTCLNRLKQVALALNNYHRANGCFPPAYIADKNGKPMYSWRVLILPYLEYDALYQQCDLTQPWDAPRNKKLLADHLREFVCPNDPVVNAPGTMQTDYFAVVGANAAWAGAKPRKLSDFGRDPSHTIMLVEATNAGISWAEPSDFSLDALGAADGKSPTFALTSDHGRREEFFFVYDHVAGVCVAMADGSVGFLRTGNRSPEDLKKVLQIGGYDNSREESFREQRHLNWPNIAALAVWLLSVGTLLTHALRSRKNSSI